MRTTPEFYIIHDDAGKDYKVTIKKAKVCIFAKLPLPHNVYTAMETTLTIGCQHCTGRSKLSPIRFSLFCQEYERWDQEDVFNREPIRRFVLAMTTNAGFLGAKRTNPFHYQTFDLSSITVYRNGHPIAGTPLNTDADKKKLFKLIGSLSFSASWSWNTIFRLSESLSDGVSPYQYTASITRLSTS